MRKLYFFIFMSIFISKFNFANAGVKVKGDAIKLIGGEGVGSAHSTLK